MRDIKHLRQRFAPNWREVGIDKIGNLYFVDISMSLSPVYVMNRFTEAVSVNAPDVLIWREERTWELIEQKYVSGDIFGWLTKPDQSSKCYSASVDFSPDEEIQVDLCLEENRDITFSDIAYFNENYSAVRVKEDVFRNAIVDKYLSDYSDRVNLVKPVSREIFKEYIALVGITLVEDGTASLAYTIEEDFNFFGDFVVEVSVNSALEIQSISLIV